MKIFLERMEIIELAAMELGKCDQHVSDLAKQMGMIYNRDMQLFEDVHQIYLKHSRINTIKSLTLNHTWEL